MTIIRYEPWALVSRVQREIERALSENADGASVSWIPHVDVREEAERFVVVADVPGVEAKDIDVTADKGVLTIKGERRSEKQATKDGFQSVERATGTFLRRFTLPESADAEANRIRASGPAVLIGQSRAADNHTGADAGAGAEPAPRRGARARCRARTSARSPRLGRGARTSARSARP